MMTRVVQWGTGNVGRQALATVMDRKDMELVGVYVSNPDKVGRDAGELCGRDPVGVAATNDVGAIEALDADVVLHMPLPSLVHGDDPDTDMQNFCRLLAAGKNVVTTVGYMYPKVYGPELVDRLEEACAAGGSVFCPTTRKR